MLIGIDANEANLTANRVGVNQYAFNLLHALYRLDTAHQFVIYLKTPPRSDLPPARPGWSYRVIPFPKLWTQTRLPFDLYTHTPRPAVFFSMTHYAPRWSPVPTVVAIMDLGFLKNPEQFTVKDFNQLKNWTAYSVKNAVKIIAISEFTKSDLVSAFSLPPEKISVTYLGYDSDRFRPTPDRSILEKYGLEPGYILFLSSLKPSKNIERLIEAFGLLSADLPATRLVIAGKKAWLYDQIYSLVKQMRLESRVVFTGFVPDSDVPALMTQSACFVLPSLYEGFGIPVLEAMACQTPTVISAVASLPEVGGEASIQVDPLDPGSIAAGIRRAINERSRFVKLGLSRVKSFSWDTCARQTLICLETATANR